jgi:hypothetical protein
MVKKVEGGSYEDMQGERVRIKGRKKGGRVGRRRGVEGACGVAKETVKCQ